MDVRVSGQHISVPVYGTDEVTLQAVEAVNKRLKEIEEESTRIDTHGFALQAAVYFAAQYRLEQERRQAEAEKVRAGDAERENEDREIETRATAQIVGRLSKIVRTLDEIIRELPPPDTR